MGNTTSTIKINGRVYDAVTGKVMVDMPPKKMLKISPPAAPSLASSLKAAKGRSDNLSVKTVDDVHQKVRKSQTLMRGSLKKPIIKSQHSAPDSASRKIWGGYGTPASRINRSKTLKKHPRVSHFGDIKLSAAKIIEPTKTGSKHHAAHHASDISGHKTSIMPSIVSSSNLKLQQMLDEALEKAPLEKDIKPRKLYNKALKRLSNATIVSAALLLFGFYTYQNMPNFSLRVAAAKSGVDAKWPDYRPSGFAWTKPVEYDQGFMKISFSGTKGLSYSIVQRKSNWDSTDLKSDFLAGSSHSYQTVQQNGKTLFIFDGNSATWLDNGMWFIVDNRANLDVEQITKIAESI